MPRPRRRVHDDLALPEPDEMGRVFVTGAQAAQFMGTTPRTIRAWREKGWLAEAGQEPSGRRQFVYVLDAVIKADAIARGVAELAA